MNSTFRLKPPGFTSEEKRKDWEKKDPSIRKGVFSILHQCADQMEIKVCIEMLCNVIVDLDIRIKELESKLNER